MTISNHLWKYIIVAMFLGIITGLLLSPHAGAFVAEDTAYKIGEWLSVMGHIFLGLIMMVVVPLVMTSIILGICQNDDQTFLRRMLSRLVPYFILTTFVAVTIGLFLSHVIRPGSYMNLQDAGFGTLSIANLGDLTIPDRIKNMIPANLAQAFLQRDMLQIVIASILIGLAFFHIGKKHFEFLLDLCASIQAICMQIIGWAMRIAPFGVFGLLADITIRVGLDTVASVGIYMLTVLLGLALLVVAYGLIIMVLAQQNPMTFFKNIREAQLLAFATSSSAATMPVSLRIAEEKLNLKPEISRLVIPLGTTINMDGTAIYQAIAAIFLCQIFGVELTILQMVLLALTTVGASIGTPATPGVGIAVLGTILASLGVPPEVIALILGVDRILDMCRTAVNVTGDLVAATVMNRIFGDEKKIP